MKNYMAIIIGCAFLTSCTYATESYLPDGAKGFNVRCGGTLNNMGSCYQKAGELCGENGFKIYGQDESRSPFLIADSQANGSIMGNQNYISGMYNSSSNVNAGNFITRNLLVSCNPQAPKISKKKK